MYRDHGDWQKLRALFHAAKAALRAASQRTGVPVDDILGRQRRSAGRFFDDRDHTTVLHSLRRMENRAAKDPELHAYMTWVRQMFPEPPASHWPLIRRPMIAAGISCSRHRLRTFAW
jgi:hypothetical protein